LALRDECKLFVRRKSKQTLKAVEFVGIRLADQFSYDVSPSIPKSGP
jgi:hypothetical protein